jgi:Glycosyl transferase family 90
MHGVLEFKESHSCGARNRSSEELFKLLLAAYPDFPDFNWVIVNTGDHSGRHPAMIQKFTSQILPDNKSYFLIHDVKRDYYPLLSWCTNEPSYDGVIPDHAFYGWPEIEIPIFEEFRLAIKSIGPPETNLMGWRGLPYTPARRLLIDFSIRSPEIYDCKHAHGADVMNPTRQHMSAQARQWRYLIDIEGHSGGYSGRVKMLLSMPRVVFLVDRDLKEYFYRWLRPWIHYVPVKHDLSDLQNNLDLIKQNPKLESAIISAAQVFSDQYLSRDFGINILRDQLLAAISHPGWCDEKSLNDFVARHVTKRQETVTLVEAEIRPYRVRIDVEIRPAWQRVEVEIHALRNEVQVEIHLPPPPPPTPVHTRGEEFPDTPRIGDTHMKNRELYRFDGSGWSGPLSMQRTPVQLKKKTLDQ